MTPNEKALDLIARMRGYTPAMFCVDEILREIQDLPCVTNERWNFWRDVQGQLFEILINKTITIEEYNEKNTLPR